MRGWFRVAPGAAFMSFVTFGLITLSVTPAVAGGMRRSGFRDHLVLP